MPEKSSPITLDMQQDVKQARRWHRQTLTNGKELTDNGSKKQLKQSWDRDSPTGTVKCMTNFMIALHSLLIGHQ